MPIQGLGEAAVRTLGQLRAAVNVDPKQLDLPEVIARFRGPLRGEVLTHLQGDDQLAERVAVLDRFVSENQGKPPALHEVVQAAGHVLAEFGNRGGNLPLQLLAFELLPDSRMAVMARRIREGSEGELSETLAELLATGGEMLTSAERQAGELMAPDRAVIPATVRLTDEEYEFVRDQLVAIGIDKKEAQKVLRSLMGRSASDKTREAELNRKAWLPEAGHGNMVLLNGGKGSAILIYMTDVYPRHWHLGDERAIIVRGGIRDHEGIYTRETTAVKPYLKLSGTSHTTRAVGGPTLFVGLFLEGGAVLMPDPVTVEPDVLMAKYAVPGELVARYFAGTSAKDDTGRAVQGILARYLTLLLDRHHQLVTLGEWKPFYQTPVDHLEFLATKFDPPARLHEVELRLRHLLGPEALPRQVGT